jgi:hypothetical protein
LSAFRYSTCDSERMASNSSGNIASEAGNNSSSDTDCGGTGGNEKDSSMNYDTVDGESKSTGLL